MHSVNPHPCSWLFLLTLKNSKNSGQFCIVFEVFLLLGIQEFQVIFQTALCKATQCTKAHGLQLKEGGNCYIRAPVLLACTTKGKGTYGKLVWLCPCLIPISTMHWQAWLHKFTRKILFTGNSPVPATEGRVTIFLTKSLQGKTIAYGFCSGSAGYNITSHPGENKFHRNIQALLTAKMVFEILFIFVQMPLGSV